MKDVVPSSLKLWDYSSKSYREKTGILVAYMTFVGRFSAYNDLLRFRIGCGGPYVKSVFVVSDCPVELLAIK